MRGHCWALSATWRGTQYKSDAEEGGDLDPRAMATRRLWAAWRDRAALAVVAQQPQEHAEQHHALAERSRSPYGAWVYDPMALHPDRKQAETAEPQPVATLHDDGYFTWKHNDLRLKYHSPYAGWRMDVYAGPVAQQPQRNGFVPPDAKIEPDLAALYAVPDGAQQPQEPRKPLYARRPSLWAMDAREALELIAAPMRPDGTWNRDRLACQQLAQEVLGKDDDA